MRDELASRGAPLDPAHVAQVLRGHGRPVGDATVLAVHDALRRDALGAGPLEPLLRLPGVTDVLVNGPDEVYVDCGHGLRSVDVRLGDEESVRRLAQRLAASAGRRLDDASPYVDVRLADGTRFHAVLSPLSRPGTALSLRIPRAKVFTLDALVEAGALPVEGAQLLRQVVEQRLAFLLCGGTGSGKTTVLNAMLSLVPTHERIVIVEDASELRPDHPHVIGLQARPANIEGSGEVTVRDLVRQALRMRPDRLVVGEVRGAEITDLLAAMNTGHEGGCGTIHANSAADVPSRIEGLGLAAGLPLAAIQAQMASAIDLVIHLGRSEGQRVVRQLAMLERTETGVQMLLTVEAGGRRDEGRSRRRQAGQGTKPMTVLLASLGVGAAVWLSGRARPRLLGHQIWRHAPLVGVGVSHRRRRTPPGGAVARGWVVCRGSGGRRALAGSTTSSGQTRC
ncbi:MAG: TadA family conjugal transfer-associated ATPase [Marmoricola sp.]